MDEKKEEKRAVMAIALLLVIALFAAIFFQQANEYFSKKNPPEQTAELCESKGALYASFTNSCMDSCGYARENSTICASVLTTGCDCGKERCWDGFECVPN